VHLSTTRRLQPLLAAILCLLLAASSVLATGPEPAPGGPDDPPPTAGPAPTAEPSPPDDPTPDPAGDPAPGPATDPSVEPVEPAPTTAPATDPAGSSAEPPAEPAEPTADAMPAPPAAEPTRGKPEAAPGRVIVLLRDGADADAAATRARGHGARVDRTFRTALRGYVAEVGPGQARRLAADPAVAAVVPDARIAGDEGIIAQHTPYGVRRIFGTKSTAARINGADERVDADVAIFDTGIDPTHTDLNVAGGYNCTTSTRSAWKDEQGHGTHVAGTVGAIDNGSGVVGVAPGVRLWSVRILDRNGEGYLSWWICGLDWIAAQKDPADPSRPLIEAVNMSVTRWGSDDGNCGKTNNDALHQAICRVVAKGITVVAAAANDSGAASKRTPAAYNEVITVSALADSDGKPGALGGNLCYSWGTYDKDDTFADFSNYGHDVDLIAPGKCIYSTKRGETYGYSSGTSMAAPHVAGAAALYLASRPGAPPSEVRWALRTMGNLDWKTSTDPDGKPEPLLDLRKLAPLADFAPAATLPATGLVTNETGASWTLPLAMNQAATFIEPISLSVARAEAPLAVALTGPTALSGTAGASALAVTVPPATPSGTYDVVVRAAYRTLRVHELKLAVVVENEPPVSRAPVASLRSGTRASLSSVPLRLAWSPAADQSPIVRYQLGETAPGGTPKAVLTTSPTTRTATRMIPFSTSRSYAVRATDLPGNVGAWAVAAPVQVRVVSESSTAVRRSSSWLRYSATDALGGRFLYADRAGAWMKYTFTGSGIAVVGRRGPTRGKAEIRIDGVLVRTVSAYASTQSGRWLLFAAAVDPSRSHTIEVRVLGTRGHPRFDVDAFLVLR
jgi:subtilisin family serine protease